MLILYLFHVFQDPRLLGSRFFRVQVFQCPGFSGSRFFRVQVFQGPGFSGFRFFRVQVFQGSGFSGSGSRVHFQVLEVAPMSYFLNKFFRSIVLHLIKKHSQLVISKKKFVTTITCLTKVALFVLSYVF